MQFHGIFIVMPREGTNDFFHHSGPYSDITLSIYCCQNKKGSFLYILRFRKFLPKIYYFLINFGYWSLIRDFFWAHPLIRSKFRKLTLVQIILNVLFILGTTTASSTKSGPTSPTTTWSSSKTFNINKGANV